MQMDARQSYDIPCDADHADAHGMFRMTDLSELLDCFHSLCPRALVATATSTEVGGRARPYLACRLLVLPKEFAKHVAVTL